MAKLFLIIAISTLPLIYAWPGGAPESACEDFTPGHDGVESNDLDSAEFFLKFAVPSGRTPRRRNLAKEGFPVKVAFFLNIKFPTNIFFCKYFTDLKNCFGQKITHRQILNEYISIHNAVVASG